MGCINFFTVTAKPRQQEKSPSYLLTPQNALSPALSKLAKVKLRGRRNPRSGNPRIRKNP